MEYQDILKLIARKDKAGLEALYKVYGQKFYSHAVIRWNLNEDDAWEVVYQTLEALVLKLSEYTFESKSHFDNFLFKVFINFLRQYYRKHRHLQVEKYGTENLFDDSSDPDAGGKDFSQETSGDESIDPSDFSVAKHALAEYYGTEVVENPKLVALRNALEELEEVDRDILLLRAQDYSYDEIAKMLKIENKQLKVRHHRIKSKLISIMDKNTLLNEQK
jgi:RNA polymerase sigma factor (sigma-70 family)